MVTSVSLEIGPSHSSEQARCQVRLRIGGERRGKLSLTRGEALRLAAVLRAGCAHQVVPVTFTITMAPDPRPTR